MDVNGGYDTDKGRRRQTPLAALPAYPDSSLVKFVEWSAAQARLRKVASALRADVASRIFAGGAGSSYLPTVAFCLALEAEERLLAELNNDYLSVPVAWDARVDLPSYPVLAADAKRYVERHEAGQGLRYGVLSSFSSWAPILDGSIDCACGRSMKLKKIDYGIWMNHIASIEGESLCLEQLIGITSADKNHLTHHYRLKKDSRVYKGLQIIWSARNLITSAGCGSSFVALGTEGDSTFKAEQLSGLVQELQIPAAKEAYDG